MNDSRSDQQVVTDHIAGDPTALAVIYDRYADKIYDTAAAMLNDRDEAADVMQDVFLIASERLAQLRDRSRLKPWLFAILRNQVYTRTKQRNRTRTVDFTAPETPEMAAPIDHRAEAGSAAYAELAELVRSAAVGLDERDQLALEYSVRGELSGEDLADALGVSLEQSYVVIHRMRERVERALGALTVARMGRDDCADLADVLAGWDGRFSVLVRKRVARHIEGCVVCEETKRRLAIIPLISAAPAFAAPVELRRTVLERAARRASTPSVTYGFEAPGGFPDAPRRHSRMIVGLVAGALVAMLLLLIGLVVVAADGPDQSLDPSATAGPSSGPVAPGSTIADDATIVESSVVPTIAPTTIPSTEETGSAAVPSTLPVVSTTAPKPAAPPPPPPPAVPVPTAPAPVPGNLVVSTGLVDFGTGLTSVIVTLTNTGDQSLNWSISGAIAPFGVSSTAGTLGPGASSAVDVVVDRATAPEGTLSADAVVVSSASGGNDLTLRAVVDRSPRVSIIQGAPDPTCPPIAVPTIIARVDDNSPVSVVLSWSGPGAAGSVSMSASGNWSGPLGVDYVDGVWSYVVTATDSSGNVGTATGPARVQCPIPG